MAEPAAKLSAPNDTVAARTFDQLRQAIVEGAMAPGSKISEPALAARFGISRGPLREALSRLEAARLVERRANTGARVVHLTHEALLELYVVREALEGMAARVAAERMPTAAIDDLHALLERHRGEIAGEHWQAYFQQEGDPDFHFRIVQGSGNRYLIDVLCEDLYHLARMYRCQFGMNSGERAAAAFREHQQIAEAVAARDGELAEALMRGHIRASRRAIERRLLARGADRRTCPQDREPPAKHAGRAQRRPHP